MKLTRYATIIVFSLITQGCAISQSSILDQDQLKIENVKEGKPYVGHVYASEKDGKLLVKGYVRLARSVRSRDPHVDLAIYSPSGELLSSISDNYYPRHTYKNGYIKGRFYAVFDELPPKGSVLRVVHHKTRTKSNRVNVDCALSKK